MSSPKHCRACNAAVDPLVELIGIDYSKADAWWAEAVVDLRHRARLLRTALFSMARRAAYWRWAYREARHELWAADLAFRLIKENWLFAQVDADQWHAKWSLADQEGNGYHEALCRIAGRGCRNAEESDYENCRAEFDKAYLWCSECLATHAVGLA